jgi:hypothetical protein
MESDPPTPDYIAHCRPCSPRAALRRLVTGLPLLFKTTRATSVWALGCPSPVGCGEMETFSFFFLEKRIGSVSRHGSFFHTFLLGERAPRPCGSLRKIQLVRWGVERVYPQSRGYRPRLMFCGRERGGTLSSVKLLACTQWTDYPCEGIRRIPPRHSLIIRDDVVHPMYDFGCSTSISTLRHHDYRFEFGTSVK